MNPDNEAKGERATTTRFIEWFKSHHPESVYVEQFKNDDGKVDLATFRWASSTELECWGVECKNVVTLSNIHNHLDQLERYHESFASVYLLSDMSRQEDSIKDFCEARGIGFCLAPPKGRVRIVTAAGVRGFDETKFALTRGIGASLLCFAGVFPGSNLKSWGANSTGDVQVNAFYDGPTNLFRFGANVENLSKAGVSLDWDSLAKVTKDLPSGSLLRVYKEVYLGRLRVTVPILSVPTTDFKGTSLLTTLATKKREVWHVNISVPMWAPYEFLSEEGHSARFRAAKEAILPVFRELGGRSPSKDSPVAGTR
jgi:hypothetical protein